MGVRRGRVSIGVLIVAGILIAASMLAFYILTQKAQPDIEEVAAQNVDHYAVYKSPFQPARSRRRPRWLRRGRTGRA